LQQQTMQQLQRQQLPFLLLLLLTGGVVPGVCTLQQQTMQQLQRQQLPFLLLLLLLLLLALGPGAARDKAGRRPQLLQPQPLKLLCKRAASHHAVARANVQVAGSSTQMRMMQHGR
jgi:hypothetical protein